MDRTQELVKALRAWRDTHNVRQKDLAIMLGFSPQGLAEVFSGRNKPTGEQALQMIEILKGENMVPVRPKSLELFSKLEANEEAQGEQPQRLPQPKSGQSSASMFKAKITKKTYVPANGGLERVAAVIKKRELRAKQLTKTFKRSEPATAPVAKADAQPGPVFSERALSFFNLAVSTLERVDMRENKRLLLAHHYLKKTNDPFMSTINPIELLKEIKNNV